MFALGVKRGILAVEDNKEDAIALLQEIVAKKELYDLRRPIPKRNRLRAQTFGNFEAYIDGKPIAFKYSKTKELLAYLIDRKGALCTSAELQAVIFEDDFGHGALPSVRLADGRPGATDRRKGRCREV